MSIFEFYSKIDSNNYNFDLDNDEKEIKDLIFSEMNKIDFHLTTRRMINKKELNNFLILSLELLKIFIILKINSDYFYVIYVRNDYYEHYKNIEEKTNLTHVEISKLLKYYLLDSYNLYPYAYGCNIPRNRYKNNNVNLIIDNEEERKNYEKFKMIINSYQSIEDKKDDYDLINELLESKYEK